MTLKRTDRGAHSCLSLGGGFAQFLHTRLWLGCSWEYRRRSHLDDFGNPGASLIVNRAGCQLHREYLRLMNPVAEVVGQKKLLAVFSVGHMVKVNRRTDPPDVALESVLKVDQGLALEVIS